MKLNHVVSLPPNSAAVRLKAISGHFVCDGLGFWLKDNGEPFFCCPNTSAIVEDKAIEPQITSRLCHSADI